MRRSARIVVLGEALVDRYPDESVLGGAPYNVARNLAALGAAPLFVSRIGVDADGERIAEQMLGLGMKMHALQRDRSHATGSVQVILHGGQPDFRIEPDGAWDWLDADATMGAVRAARPALAYFGTLAQRSAPARAAIRAGLAASAASRFLDLNLREMPDVARVAMESLELADVLKVNDEELRAVLSWSALPAAGAETEAVFGLMERYRLHRIVLTRGAQGWRCYEAAGRRVLEGAAPWVAVRDTVGAGDAFASVMLLGELRGWRLEATLERAARFAASVCTLRGAFDEKSPIYADAVASWERDP